MKKLKLESLEVTSFATTPAAAAERGTVNANARPGPLETYNVDRCGETQYFDCSLGCSRLSDCPYSCVEM